MANTTENKEVKDAGAAQGAATNPAELSQETAQGGELTVEVEAPKWAVELTDVCSKVLDAIAQFNANAETVVKDIIAEAKAEGSAQKPQEKVATTVVDVKINKKAKYVVAKGKAFHSTLSNGLVGEGTDVSGLEPDRLKALIAQGIAVEVSED